MKTPDWKTRLSALPSLACVAFACRCARRVQPLFLVSWPEAPQRLYQLLDGAIETVEESARSTDRTTSTFAFNAMSAVKSASRAGAEQAAAVASTVTCATYALTAVGYGNLSSTHAAQAADYTVETFSHDPGPAQAEAQTAAVEALTQDLQRIEEGLQSGAITPDAPLPPGFLGPLWPHGEPDYAVQLPHLQ